MWMCHLHLSFFLRTVFFYTWCYQVPQVCDDPLFYSVRCEPQTVNFGSAEASHMAASAECYERTADDVARPPVRAGVVMHDLVSGPLARPRVRPGGMMRTISLAVHWDPRRSSAIAISITRQSARRRSR